jgi:hypothetical protein
VSELAANPHVEVCWYFPTSREQFRLSGTAHIVALDHPDQQLLAARQQAWAAMSDSGAFADVLRGQRPLIDYCSC